MKEKRKILERDEMKWKSRIKKEVINACYAK
jgi:hypothetical protein